MSDPNSTSVTLRQAPQCLLDGMRWGMIIGFAKTEIRALQILNAPRPDRSSGGFWNAYSDDDVVQQRFWQLGREHCLEFRRQMRTKQVFCFGYPPASAERIMIPHDREDLWPRFVTGKVVGRDIEFSDVLVVRACDLGNPRQQTFHAAEKLIKTKFALGEPLDKKFKFEVRQRFPDLRAREIDVLFANLSGRKPGAPRRRNPAH